MARQPLRAVAPGEKVAPISPKTVAQAAKGSQRDLLVAMRDRIAKAVTEDCPPRDLASLTKRLADLAKEIDTIDARAVDDPAARMRELEAALREVAPDHELLIGADIVDDRFDASAI